jgi:hypothetical protein
MKRAKFKKPFNGMDNALKLIPESYKVDGHEFEITDGVDTYRVRWDVNEATVLSSENKHFVNEDMNKIKHLMGYKSKNTLGNLEGEERINENKSFSGLLDKTKKLMTESTEETKVITEGEENVNEMISGKAGGMGFTGEGNLEGNEPMAEMEKMEEEVNEATIEISPEQMEMLHKDGKCDCGEHTLVYKKEEVDEATKVSATGYDPSMEDIDKKYDLEEGSEDVEKFFAGMGDNAKINTLASKINTRPEKVEAAIEMVKKMTGGDAILMKKIARELMGGDAQEDLAQQASDSNMNEEGEMCEGCGDDYMEEMDRFDEVFDGVNEELSPEQSKEMDTDKDGDIDAEDLANLRKGAEK